MLNFTPLSIAESNKNTSFNLEQNLRQDVFLKNRRKKGTPAAILVRGGGARK